jgi:NADH-quinone oxidoreductase subunit M
MLAAVLLKMGTYGFLRFLLPLFPEAAQHPTVVTVMLVLGVIGILYAAWVAAVQPDAKKLVAYTSVAHMGFVVLGVFALTVNGATGRADGDDLARPQHGRALPPARHALRARHTRLIADFGGLGAVAPWLATAFVITALASIGLPGTSGFVGEFLALLGTFETHPWIATDRDPGRDLRRVLHAADGAAHLLQPARQGRERRVRTCPGARSRSSRRSSRS